MNEGSAPVQEISGRIADVASHIYYNGITHIEVGILFLDEPLNQNSQNVGQVGGCRLEAEPICKAEFHACPRRLAGFVHRRWQTG